MAKIDKKFVNEVLYRRLLYVIPDSIEAGEVANALQDEVVRDIAETADHDNWHSGDIDIALGRVLKKRLLPENDEPQKVWVLTNHAATECEYLGTNNRVFAKKEDALKALAEWKKDEEVYVKRYEWNVRNDTPEHYEACEEGDYCANHTEGFINEYEVE